MSRADEVAALLQEHGRIAYKRLISHFAAEGRKLATISLRLNFAKSIVRACERRKKPGVLPLAMVLQLGVPESTARAWLKELAQVRGPAGELEWLVGGGQVTMLGFFMGAEHRANLEAQWRQQRFASAKKARDYRGRRRALAGPKVSRLEKAGPKPKAKSGVRAASPPIIEPGSRNTKTHPDPTKVVASTAADAGCGQTAAGEDDFEAQALALFRSIRDERSQPQQPAAQTQAPPKAPPPEVYATPEWFVAKFGKLLPDFRAQVLSKRRLRRKSIEASVCVVGRQSSRTQRNAAGRVYSLACRMDETTIYPGAFRQGRP